MSRPFFENCLREQDRQVLDALGGQLAESFYLAGGTALALQIGHRLSYDLDFFSSKPFRNDVMKNQLSGIGSFSLIQDSKGTIEAVVDETRVTFLEYASPMLALSRGYHHVQIASPLDIALMKLSAVSSRGSRKDFVDLYCLRDRYSIRTLFERFDEKFQDSGYNRFHIIKSLAYFDDAESEPMPNMIVPIEWEDIKSYFMDSQNELIKETLSVDSEYL